MTAARAPSSDTAPGNCRQLRSTPSVLGSSAKQRQQALLCQPSYPWAPNSCPPSHTLRLCPACPSSLPASRSIQPPATGTSQRAIANMGGAHQPFLYDSASQDARFPESTFDPKAVTRASWEPKPPKPKQDGPYLSLNRHPEYMHLATSRAPSKWLGETNESAVPMRSWPRGGITRPRAAGPRPGLKE